MLLVQVQKIPQIVFINLLLEIFIETHIQSGFRNGASKIGIDINIKEGLGQIGRVLPAPNLLIDHYVSGLVKTSKV